MAAQSEEPHNNEELTSTSNGSSTEKLRRTLTQFPPTESNKRTPEATGTQVLRLTLPKIILLGACANLTMLSNGFSFNAMSISLEKAARDLKIAEKDLQIIVENTSPGRTRSILLSMANMGLPMGNLAALGVVGPLIETTDE
ncbi:hypothetical protein QFC24_002064 [Naganishia onofrii]|uniref:Uncharacterized protein n=1 Tax=Naganishia onofrii TaxID=1851511 RepID=A0ACC2XSG2_9TREE|nr:hypothetical protein QFC24_002064 [Naganishia onofrii]